MRENEEIMEVLDQLSILEPVGIDAAPSAQMAFDKLSHTVARPVITTSPRRYRWLSLVATFVVIISGLMAFPSTRALASEFLGFFRVEKFAAISVSPQQLELLAELSGSGLFPAEIVAQGEYMEPIRFDDYVSAETHMRQLDKPTISTTFNSLGEPDFINVDSRGDVVMTLNLAGARDLLTAVGGDPESLPDTLANAEIDVQINDVLTQQWFQENVLLAQTLSPEVAYPDGVEPTVIGAALLQFLGMGVGEASRVAHAIDWTTTMILPVPTDLGTFSEVEIGDATGLAIEPIGVGATLVWQQGDKMYVLTGYGENTTVSYLLDLIENGQFR